MPRPKEKVRTVSMFVYCSPEVKKFAKQRAAKLGTSYSEFINRLVERERAKVTHDRKAA